MLIEIFEGLFLPAGSVEQIQSRKEREGSTVVRVWTVDKTGSSYAEEHDTIEDAREAAEEIARRVNHALEYGTVE